MIDDKLKEKIQMLICGDLESNEIDKLQIALNGSKELQNYYQSSKLALDKLNDIPEIEPSSSYVSDFWNKVDKNKSNRFWLFNIFKINWQLAGSFAVFFIASAFFVNSYFSNGNSEFAFSEDVEIMNQLDSAITLNSDSSLEVYGPW